MLPELLVTGKIITPHQLMDEENGQEWNMCQLLQIMGKSLSVNCQRSNPLALRWINLQHNMNQVDLFAAGRDYGNRHYPY